MSHFSEPEWAQQAQIEPHQRKSSLIPVVHRGNPAEYLRLYFNFCYYTLIIPFRFEFCEVEGTYKLKTNPLQKALCCLTLSLCLLEEAIFVRLTIHGIQDPEGDGVQNPEAYFQIVHVCSTLLYYVTVMKTIWWNSKQFLGVMKALEVHPERAYPTSSPFWSTKAKIWMALTLLPFIIYPTTFISGFYLRNPTWTRSQVIRHWSGHLTFLFFSDGFFPEPASTFRQILAAVRIITLIGYTQMTTSMEVLLLNCAMVLSDAVKDFNDVVRDAAHASCQMVIKEYELLRSLSRKLNRAVGFLIFGGTVGCLPYFVVNLLAFIRPESAASFIRHAMFFTNLFGFLLLAAQVNKRAQFLEDWLMTRRNFAEIPAQKISILLHDLAGQNIGFSGAGLFKITPKFIGTIISLLLTFSIIIIQFRSSTTG